MSATESSETPEALPSRGGAPPVPTERIFPIRHLNDELSEWSGSGFASTEPNSDTTAAGQSSGQDGNVYESPPYPSIPPPDQLKKLPSTENTPSWTEDPKGESGPAANRHITERAQLVPKKDGGEPGVLPGPPPSEPVLLRCEDEPIHIPGAIQQYGALVALRYDDASHLLVRLASENTKAIMGHDPEALFALSSFHDVLPNYQVDDFVTRVNYTFSKGQSADRNTDLDVFELSILSPFKGHVKFWCALHLEAGSEDTVICEVEPQYDPFFPGDPGHKTLPPRPIRTLDNDIVEEERIKSITKMNEPLRVIQIAKEQHQRLGFMEMFNAMSQVQFQLAACDSIQEILDVVVGLISEISAFHRVMAYRFDEAANGCVVAEIVDARASDDLFRGLHFPASDIPVQARDLYKINKIRILFDRDEETARLVGRDTSDLDRPLDLTHAFLRAMSPIHLKYLSNMGVRSSMSISLVINNELWGLVACHSYGDSGIRVSLPMRELCRNIGECASSNIARLLLLKRLRTRQPPPQAAHPPQSPSAFIAASSADLLRIFDSDFGILSIQGEGRAIGRLEPYREALALVSHLQKAKSTTILASQNVMADFSNINYAPGIKSIAGLLVVPLSFSGEDFIVFFRRAQLKEVRWAGNPYEKLSRGAGSDYLEPRSSFRRWIETVVGLSREWTEDHIETASVLGLLYGRFIDVWRQQEVTNLKIQRTRLLLENSSHDVRTPLKSIINYLETALKGPLEGEVRESLQGAHRNTRSLVYVVDDLLSLAISGEREVVSNNQSFDLCSVIAEGLAEFQGSARRKGVSIKLFAHQDLPDTVGGDPERLRNALQTVTSNALKCTQQGEIRVDVRPVRSQDHSSEISISVTDTGPGLSEAQLDNLFQDFEQVVDEQLDSGNIRSTSALQKKESMGDDLSVVARYARNMNGKIRMQSELGKGTVFTLELPFDHALPEPLKQLFSPRHTLSKFSNPFGPIKTIRIEETTEIPLPTPTRSEPVEVPMSISRTLPLRTFGSSSTVTPSIPDMISGSNYSGDDSFSEVSTQNSPLTILVAEDNPINAKILHRRLKKSGHKVVTVLDGKACYDRFRSRTEKYDVILMDLRMPIINGREAARMIRAFETSHLYQGPEKRIPIIAVSASLEERNRYDYMMDGFDGWLLKPISHRRLEVLFAGLYDRSTRMRAMYIQGETAWESGGWFNASGGS